MEGGDDGPHGVVAHDAAQAHGGRHVGEVGVGRGNPQRGDSTKPTSNTAIKLLYKCKKSVSC